MDLDKYQRALASMSEKLFSSSTKPSALRIYPEDSVEDSQGIAVYYSPFEHVNENARAVFVGITPGDSQMRRAWLAAKRAIDEAQEVFDAIWEVKRVSSFNDNSGQMRRNIYRQAEHWHVHTWLGLDSGEALFGNGWSQIQTTSVVQFPTFLRGGNYNGQSPAPLKHNFLRKLVRSRLVDELQKIPEAVVFSFGSKVATVVTYLKNEGLISNPVSCGMFHPSGNNTYRFDYLCGDRKGPPPHQTSPDTYDQGRTSFVQKYVPGAL